MTNEDMTTMIETNDLETIEQVTKLAKRLLALNTREAQAMAKAAEKVKASYAEQRRRLADEFPPEVRKIVGVE